jgi:hypothetical protein
MFGIKFVCCAILLNGFACSAQSPHQLLTILLRFEHPASSTSTVAMKKEIQYLLGKEINVEFGTEIRSSVTAGRLVVFRMLGHCSIDQPVQHQRNGLALGSTFVSDGSILPFGQLECDRIQGSLQRLDRLTPRESQQQLGQAIGRVLVHELYHMLSGSSEHTKDGLTKRALSPLDLTAHVKDLPLDSRVAMEIGTQAEPK